jgi:hypothetical protein
VAHPGMTELTPSETTNLYAVIDHVLSHHRNEPIAT